MNHVGPREGGGASSTHIFADNRLESMREDLPGENLYVLLDVAWFGIRKAHDDFEKFLAVCLGLGNREWAESFEIAADAILLLHREANIDQLFQEIDGIHAGGTSIL